MPNQSLKNIVKPRSLRQITTCAWDCAPLKAPCHNPTSSVVPSSTTTCPPSWPWSGAGSHTNLVVPMRRSSPQPLVHRHSRPLRSSSQVEQDHREFAPILIAILNTILILWWRRSTLGSTTPRTGRKSLWTAKPTKSTTLSFILILGETWSGVINKIADLQVVN